MGGGGCNTSNNLEKATFDRRYSSCAIEHYANDLHVHDLDSVKLNQYAKYQGQRSSSSSYCLDTQTDTQTYTADCSTWTTNVVFSI